MLLMFSSCLCILHLVLGKAMPAGKERHAIYAHVAAGLKYALDMLLYGLAALSDWTTDILFACNLIKNLLRVDQGLGTE